MAKLKQRWIPKSNQTFYLFFFFFPFLFRAPLVAGGGSQARSLIGATAASLHHSHNARSQPHLQPTPQLTAMPDP